MPEEFTTNSSLTEADVRKVLDRIKEVYLQDGRPWIVGYSGGKDSTCALQLTWLALLELDPADRTKPVYVISSDTLVELPSVVSHVNVSHAKINAAARASKMPIEAHAVTPLTDHTFWVNLIGRGYPAPYTSFRWCTDRMKIRPTTTFITSKVSEYGEAVIVLGARISESASRAQVMAEEKIVEKTVGEGKNARTTRKRRGRKMVGVALARHKDIGGAYIFTPIEDWSTDDVWQYLISTPPPWDSSNRELITMYRNAQAGECPLVIDKSTPSCGGGRFGCWTCTVVQKDRSMEAMIDNGEEWLEPLLDFRDWLTDTQDPENKAAIREHRRRTGRVEFFLSPDGKKKLRWGPYTLDMRKEILRRLLTAEKEVNALNPEASFVAVQPDELHRIRQLWLHDEGDWRDSLPTIYTEVTGKSLEWLTDDFSGMGGLEKRLLDDIARDFEIPEGLMTELFDVERKHFGMARRSGIRADVERVLNKDWQSRDETLSDIGTQEQEDN